MFERIGYGSPGVLFVLEVKNCARAGACYADIVRRADTVFVPWARSLELAENVLLPGLRGWLEAVREDRVLCVSGADVRETYTNERFMFCAFRKGADDVVFSLRAPYGTPLLFGMLNYLTFEAAFAEYRTLHQALLDDEFGVLGLEDAGV